MRTVVACCLVVMTFVGCSASSSGRVESGTLWWKDCGSDGAQCATLTVPLDYAQPEGEQASIALLRYRATKTNRRGALLINPGGPGMSGVGFLRSTGRQVVAPSVAAEYDLVTWDPRGTGASIPMKCGDRLDYLFDGVSYSPTTADQRAALVVANRRFTDACRQGMGTKLSFIGTRDTVADMERIRIALGAPTLNMLGFSYGTYLGARYASAYPATVGRVVLDGAVDPSLSAAATVRTQAGGFERSIDTFFAACAVSLQCAWSGSEPPATAYRSLMNRVATTPVPVAFGASVGPAQFDIGVASLLYRGAEGWPTLNRALETLARGDGTQIFAAFSSYVGRSGRGEYDSSYAAFLGIGCVDAPPIGTPEATLAFADSLAAQFPVFGPSSVNLSIACSMWPVPPTSSPAPAAAPGANPMLIVATSGDPATPLAWGEALHAQLAGSVLITSPGEQHTSYLQGSTCVDDAINAYFVEGRAPENPLRCAA